MCLVGVLRVCFELCLVAWTGGVFAQLCLSVSCVKSQQCTLNVTPIAHSTFIHTQTNTHTHLKHTDELWRHLGQFGLEVGDEEAGAPFGGRHPTEILTAMEQTRWGLVATSGS